MCDFTGKFSNPKKINDYTYSVQIENIEQERETDTEEITEGLRTIYSKPYGLDGAKDVLIYLPGSPLKELPEEFLDWVYHNDEERKKDTVLPFYGIYNVASKDGFSSYDCDNTQH
jgi:hypothetical protein